MAMPTDARRGLREPLLGNCAELRVRAMARAVEFQASCKRSSNRIASCALAVARLRGDMSAPAWPLGPTPRSAGRGTHLALALLAQPADPAAGDAGHAHRRQRHRSVPEGRRAEIDHAGTGARTERGRAG